MSKTRKEKEGSMKRSSSNLRKRYRKNNPEKIAKTLRTAATRPFSATSPTRTQNATHPRAKKIILKTTSALQPQAVFYLPNPIWSKFRASEQKNTFVRRTKIILKNCAESRRLNVSTASSRATKMPNRPETPCFEAFRVLVPLGVRRQELRRQRREKKPNFAKPQNKKRKKNLRDGIFEKKSHHLLRIIDSPKNASPHCALQKQCFREAGAAN